MNKIVSGVVAVLISSVYIAAPTAAAATIRARDGRPLGTYRRRQYIDTGLHSSLTIVHKSITIFLRSPSSSPCQTTCHFSHGLHVTRDLFVSFFFSLHRARACRATSQQYNNHSASCPERSECGLYSYSVRTAPMFSVALTVSLLVHLPTYLI